jgi:hypothetical protein
LFIRIYFKKLSPKNIIADENKKESEEETRRIQKLEGM